MLGHAELKSESRLGFQWALLLKGAFAFFFCQGVAVLHVDHVVGQF